MPLTDQEVKNAKPREKAYKLNDGSGLYLHVSPTGRKTWRYRFKIAGAESVLVLGEYPDVTLLQARIEAGELRRKVKAGVSPSKERQAERQAVELEREQAIRAAESSFQNIALEWHEREKGRWTKDHAAAVWATLEADVFPAIGMVSIEQVTPPMVLEVIKAIESRDALIVAQKVLQRMTAVFRFAIQTGRAHYNPATEMRGIIKKRPVQHRTMLSISELPGFLRSLSVADIHISTRLALEFVILTAARTGEVRGATWEEIDLEKRVWSIPGHRMKMKIEHTVPLSSMAVAILERAGVLFGKNGLVFTGDNPVEKRPLSENTLLYAMYRMGYHGRATVHGFRALFSTIANESGFNPDAIERQLAHAEKNQVRAAYHRSEYLAERMQLMQWWADYLAGLRGGSITP